MDIAQRDVAPLSAPVEVCEGAAVCRRLKAASGGRGGLLDEIVVVGCNQSRAWQVKQKVMSPAGADNAMSQLPLQPVHHIDISRIILEILQNIRKCLASIGYLHLATGAPCELIGRRKP